MAILKFFCILFLLSTGTIYSSTPERVYLDNIRSGTEISESLWALSLSYYDSPDEERKKIVQNIEDYAISTALAEHDNQLSFIRFINKELNSETLLLYLLLNEEALEERGRLYEQFYSGNEPGELQEINRRGVELEQAGSLLKDEFRFEHFLLSQYTSVADLWDEELALRRIKEWIGRSTGIPETLSDELKLFTIATIANRAGEAGLFTGLYDQLIELQLFPRSFIKRDLFWRLDIATYRAGQIDKSLHIQREITIPITEYLQDNNTLYNLYSNKGGYLYLLSRYQEAGQVFGKVLENEDQISDANLTRLLNNLSLVYFETGESSKYVSTQLRALEHAEKLGNYNHQFNIYRNLHLFYKNNNNWSLARYYLEAAEKVAIMREDENDLITILLSKALLEYENHHDVDKALESIYEAIDLFSDNVELRVKARILYEKSELLRLEGMYSRSRSVLQKMLDDYSSDLVTPVFLEISLKIANLEFLMGNYQEAMSLLTEFSAHDISVVNHPTFILSRTLRANLDVHNNYHTRAEAVFSETADFIFERARNSADFESGYWSVEQEYLDFFESYADFLISQNRPEEAILLLDQFKTINDAVLFENPLVKETRLTEAELAEERRLTERMDEVRRKLFNASGSARLALYNELEQLNASRTEITQNLEHLPQHDLPSIWSVQRKLAGNQMIYHVAEINNSYYISHIFRDKVTVTKKQVTSEIQDLFENAIRGMVSGRTDLNSLYQAGLFLGIDQIPQSVKSVILMPDGYLHQLPIGVIPLRETDSAHSYGSAEYFIEHVSVRNINRLSDFTQRNRRSAFTHDYSGFGVSDFENERTGRNLISLPNAPGEVQDIADLLNRFGNRSVFVESDASTDAFRNHAASSRILHLASHSEISESDPLFSRIHFSSPELQTAGEPETQLFAYQLFDLNLQNELIMLNSCESGAGRFMQGSGIMGISRALRYAGANSLVLNGWSVNDHFAAEFAKIFYSHLNDGKTKSRALQLTKIDFIQGSNANPHYWGPYILNGNDEPLIRQTGTQAGNLLLAITFIAGLVMISYRKRNGSN